MYLVVLTNHSDNSQTTFLYLEVYKTDESREFTNLYSISLTLQTSCICTTFFWELAAQKRLLQGTDFFWLLLDLFKFHL